MSECRHCGEEVSYPGAEFCCTGCETVFTALHDGGLDRFYALRGKVGVQPVEGGGRAFEPAVEPLGDGTVEAWVGVDGLHCAGCVWLIQKMPSLLDGVVESDVQLGRGRLRVRWRPGEVSFEDVARWLGRFGYAPFPLGEEGAERVDAERRALARLGTCWALAMNVMLIAIALYAGLGPADGALWHAARWASLVLTAGVVFYGGAEVFRRAASSLWTIGRGKIHVDLPVALGVLVGFAGSAYHTVIGAGEVWFDSVAVLVAALLGARWLHTRGLRIAVDSTNRLSALVPTTARVRRASGVEVTAVSELRAGDVVEVRRGDVAPGDGVVVEGQADVDMSHLTGESRVHRIDRTHPIFAGTAAVSGFVAVQLTAVGEDTRFGRLTRWVLDSDRHRAPVVMLADRLAAWFIGAILIGALIVAVVTGLTEPEQTVERVVALLVVTCPCALAMATPLAFSTAVGRAAQRGIFVRNDAVFETLGGVDVALLDKTGTLTTGAMNVVERDGVDAALLAEVAAVERLSDHPIARAFDRWDEELEVTDFETMSRGVRGRVRGRTIEVVGEPSVDARTRLSVRVEGEVHGTITLEDEVRDETLRAVETLRNRGVDVRIASGDDPLVVEAVASRLGIAPERARARCSPEEKLSMVQMLQSEGRRVLMVGDGVNDAAALKAADVGVAMYRGADLNAGAADVQLGRAGLAPLIALIDEADHTRRVVRQNLGLSATYNALAVTGAILGLVTPLVAAVAMPLSSVAVVASSLRAPRRQARAHVPPADRAVVARAVIGGPA